MLSDGVPSSFQEYDQHSVQLSDGSESVNVSIILQAANSLRKGVYDDSITLAGMKVNTGAKIDSTLSRKKYWEKSTQSIFLTL